MNGVGWWWLSFVDADGRFLGVAIVDVGPSDLDEALVSLIERGMNTDDVAQAIGAAAARAWQLGCNPGGQVAAFQLPSGVSIPGQYRRRLLNKAEAEAAGV